MHRFILAAVVICFASAGYSQERGRGGAFVRVNVEAAIVKGAPYSADVINESVQTLSDGNRIVRRSTARVYRDSEGRLRREEDRGAGSPEITITDPVAGSSWTLDAENHIARQGPLSPFLLAGTLSTVIGDLEARRLERVTAILNGVPTDFTVGPNGRGSLVQAGSEQSAGERLAPRTIEGLRVEGTRRATTIAPGAIGNKRAIVATTEEWTSPELKTLVLSEYADPRSGTSTYKLVNVRKGEPAASLFQVPADYSVVQAPGRGEGRGDGRGEGRGGRGGAPR